MKHLDARRVGVARFLLDAIHEAEPAARRRDVELRCAWESRLGAVLVDVRRMHQLLCTLLLRAVERVALRGMVLVTAERLGDEVRFCIADSSDDGATQLDETLATFPSWSALEELLVAHGGRLWVDAAVGASTTYFTLLASPRAMA